MTVEQELQLSWYRQVAAIDEEHSVFLVQDVRDGKFYVKKLLTVYNLDIYRHLQAHPIENTPRIYLLREENGILTLIEEYIPGDTLEELLEKQGPFTDAEAVRIIRGLCAVLEAFHSCQPPIVNRDIKPSNIKLTPEGTVKLLDMNAAKWSNDQEEKDTVLLGTQGYAAPEQYGFGPSSVLTDIYAVGALLHVLRTGQLPGRQIREDRLGAVIRKCTALAPENRYQSVAQLLAALEQAPSKPDQGKSRKRYLPPGFRTENKMRWLLSALGYGFILYIGTGLRVENPSGLAEVILNRVFFTAALLMIVFFNGNYLDIQDRFPLVRRKSRWLRWLMLLFVDFVILCLCVIVLGLLVNALSIITGKP